MIFLTHRKYFVKSFCLWKRWFHGILAKVKVKLCHFHTVHKFTYFRNQHQRLSRMLKWFASHSSNPKMANLSTTTFAKLEMKWQQSRSWWTMWENIFWARVWNFESWINAVKPTSNTTFIHYFLFYHLTISHDFLPALVQMLTSMLNLTHVKKPQVSTKRGKFTKFRANFTFEFWKKWRNSFSRILFFVKKSFVTIFT